jgi:hypothetical protein
MEYKNKIGIVTTEQGLRDLIGNPIFEAASKIERTREHNLFYVEIELNQGWFISDTTEDIINRIVSDNVITTGVTAAAQHLVSTVLAQTHGEFVRLGDNPKDVEKYVKLDTTNPKDSRILYTEEEKKEIEEKSQEKLFSIMNKSSKMFDKNIKDLNEKFNSLHTNQQPMQQPTYNYPWESEYKKTFNDMFGDVFPGNE